MTANPSCRRGFDSGHTRQRHPHGEIELARDGRVHQSESVRTSEYIAQVALFTVHILNTGADETSRAARLAYLNAVRPFVNPVDEVFFAGRIDLETLSFVDRLMVKMVRSPIGDFRDWDGIRAWSAAILQ
ncbi:MAG: flavodoxin domain-containing protein [Marinilabiliales bacterium]|nr:flavodoxin domain-containing protein [Marinilabiliales bacterium]